MVLCTDYTGSCKSNYHTITTTTVMPIDPQYASSTSICYWFPVDPLNYPYNQQLLKEIEFDDNYPILVIGDVVIRPVIVLRLFFVFCFCFFLCGHYQQQYYRSIASATKRGTKWPNEWRSGGLLDSLFPLNGDKYSCRWWCQTAYIIYANPLLSLTLSVGWIRLWYLTPLLLSKIFQLYRGG